jgi:hypothetical protein
VSLASSVPSIAQTQIKVPLPVPPVTVIVSVTLIWALLPPGPIGKVPPESKPSLRTVRLASAATVVTAPEVAPVHVVEYVAEVVEPLQPSPALYEIVISEPEQGLTAKKTVAAKPRMWTGLTFRVQALETKEALVHSEGQCLVPSRDVHGKRQLKTARN